MIIEGERFEIKKLKGFKNNSLVSTKSEKALKGIGVEEG